LRSEAAIVVIVAILISGVPAVLALGQGGPVEQNVTASPGVVQTLHFECWASPNNQIAASALITATGEAAGWVAPVRLGCGVLNPGDDFQLPYNLTVPAGEPPGKYQLNWVGDCGPGCTFVSPGLVTITVPGPASSSTSTMSLVPPGVLPVALALVVVLVAVVMLAAIYWLRRRYPDAAT